MRAPKNLCSPADFAVTGCPTGTLADRATGEADSGIKAADSGIKAAV